MTRTAPRIAILVDADNVDSTQIAFAVTESATRGQVIIRRAFGRLSALKGRERALADLGFQAEVALPASSRTKDTADLMLAQYAVRLAERGVVEIVALVSSDSDFAAIAQGIAEAGVATIGFGRADAPPALRSACTEFVVIKGADAPAPAPRRAAKGEKPAKPSEIPAKTLEKLRRIITAAMDKNGNARTQPLGGQLNRAFDGDYKRFFDVKTLSELIMRLDGFEVTNLPGNTGVAQQVVRKAGKPAKG